MDVDALKNELLTDEGFSQFACKGSSGKGTLAIGRKIDATAVTMDEALHMLDNDIRRVQRELDKFFPWWRGLSGKRQRAVANLTFNLGIGKLAASFHTLKHLKTGEYEQAADSLLASEYARQDPQRALRLAKLIEEE
jgi:GH24 family phage-related lysozyme (muramidase)